MDFSEVMKHRERSVITDAREGLASTSNRGARGAEAKGQTSKRGSFFSLPIRAVRSLSRVKRSEKPPKSGSDKQDVGEFRASVTSDEERSVPSQSPVVIPLRSKSPVGIPPHDEGGRASGQRWRAGKSPTATTASTGEPSSTAAAAAAKLGQTSVHELVREKIPPDFRWRRPRQSSYALAVIDRLAGDCSNNGNPQSDAVVPNDDHHHPHTSVKGSERRGAYDKGSGAGRRDTFLRGYPIVDAGAVFSDTDDSDDDDDGDGDGLLPNTPIHNDVQRFLKNRPGRSGSGLRGRVTSTGRYQRVPETAPSDDEGSSWTPRTPPASLTPPLTPPTSLTPPSPSSWVLSESSSDEFAGSSSVHRNRLSFFQHVIPNAYEFHRGFKVPSSLCSSLSPERADVCGEGTDGDGTGRSTVKALASWSSLASILLSSSDDKDINS